MNIDNGYAVAVSGGQDSLLALALLKEQGAAALALHAHFIPPNEAAIEKARALREQCRSLGVEFYEADLSREFEAGVVAPFVADYAAGLTPNPCAHCNRVMKFGALMDKALELGAGGLATGHYARIVEHPDYGPALARGFDRSKDQSYFLSLVHRRAIERSHFPLGETNKRDVPEMLASRGLTPPLESESQEVCFVPGDDYRAFLRGRGLDSPQEGPILKDGREIGRHEGLWNYTLGQRRGIRVAWSEPLYVIGKDSDLNALIVGAKDELPAFGCSAGDVNFMVPLETWPGEIFAQTRYRQKARPVTAKMRDGRLALSFMEPQTLPTPGQIAVVYDGAGLVLAGGIIQS